MLTARQLVLILVPLALAEWSPPANPDPDQILQEARADAAAGRHPDAYAKYAWFYSHALEIKETLAGVRNSYVVKEWSALGKAHPPALAKLKQVRDEAVNKVKEGKDVKRQFSDVSAINSALGEDKLTHELFLHLDANQPKAAKEAYPVAQATLFARRDFKVCSKYIDIKEAIPRLTKSVQTIHEVHKIGGFNEEERAQINAVLFENCAECIALLVLNDRRDDAVKVASALRKEWDDKGFHAAIDLGLKGKLPKR